MQRFVPSKERALYRPIGPRSTSAWAWNTGTTGISVRRKRRISAGLALDPKDTHALQNYALLLMKTGEPEKAIDPLLTLKAVPELTLPARVSLIECYLKTGDRQRADKETDEFLRAGIAGPEEETKLGAILVEAGDPEAAEKAFRASLKQQPDQAEGVRGARRGSHAQQELCRSRRISGTGRSSRA